MKISIEDNLISFDNYIHIISIEDDLILIDKYIIKIDNMKILLLSKNKIIISGELNYLKMGE